MSEVGFIALSALFLAVPVGVKYALAFQARNLLEAWRQQERRVRLLEAQLAALEGEKSAARRALRQVQIHRRQARLRLALQEERLEEEQQRRAAARQRRPQPPSADLQMPVLEEVVEVDGGTRL